MKPMFEIITPENSAKITMNDNLNDAKRHSGNPVPPETWIVGRDPRAIAWAVFSYARKHGIAASQVGYSLVFDG